MNVNRRDNRTLTIALTAMVVVLACVVAVIVSEDASTDAADTTETGTAMVGDQSYTGLKAAFDAAVEESRAGDRQVTVEMQTDCAGTGLFLSDGTSDPANIVIDFNGHTFTCIYPAGPEGYEGQALYFGKDNTVVLHGGEGVDAVGKVKISSSPDMPFDTVLYNYCDLEAVFMDLDGTIVSATEIDWFGAEPLCKVTFRVTPVGSGITIFGILHVTTGTDTAFYFQSEGPKEYAVRKEGYDISFGSVTAGEVPAVEQVDLVRTSDQQDVAGYEVTYMCMGVDVTDAMTGTDQYDAGSTVTVTDRVPFSISTFIGWSTTEGATEATYVAGDMFAITSDMMFHAVFTENNDGCLIQISSNYGGQVSPGTTIMPKYGNDTFRIVADLGYMVGDVLLDGVSVGAKNLLTVHSKNANHILEVRFIPSHGTATSVGQDGTITEMTTRTGGTVTEEVGRITTADGEVVRRATIRDAATGVETVGKGTAGEGSIDSRVMVEPVIEGGLAVASVPQEMMEEVAKQSDLAAEYVGSEEYSGSICIEVTSSEPWVPKEIKKSEVHLGLGVKYDFSSNIFEQLSYKFSFNTPTGTVEYMGLTSLENKELIEFTIGTVEVSEIPSIQGMNHDWCYDLTLFADGEEIHELGGTATVTVPIEPKVKTPSHIVYVYRFDGLDLGSGDASGERIAASYDPVNECVTWTTDHHSYFVIAFEPSDAGGDNGDTTIIAACVAMAIVAAVVVGVYCVVRKRA